VVQAVAVIRSDRDRMAQVFERPGRERRDQRRAGEASAKRRETGYLEDTFRINWVVSLEAS